MSRATRATYVQSRVWIVLAVLAAVSVITPTAAGASAGDVGHEDLSFQGAIESPSGSKPQSKLWFNDGRWWASMFATNSQDFHIFRLDTSTQDWVDTGTTLDDRLNSRADVLWDGSKLFVASHVFSESPTSEAPSRLYRYSYNSSNKTYTLDAGFPAQINNFKTETLVIDKNIGANARLWATWVQNNTVYVNSANADGTSWGTPFALPVSNATVAEDDISSLVSYESNKIVVVWSNQIDSNVYYSVHVDGNADSQWSPARTALSGPGFADDHISLRSLQEANGKIYAAVKTSLSNAHDPLTLLLEYNPAQGQWRSYTYGLKKDAHTRPIVMLDKGASKVYMFATAPESGGSIYMKSAPLSDIAFPAGRGTAVMTDGTGGTKDDINNATSTKQAVDSSTGLVVLATNDTTQRYWHAYLPLGGNGGGTSNWRSISHAPEYVLRSVKLAFTMQHRDGYTEDPLVTALTPVRALSAHLVRSGNSGDLRLARRRSHGRVEDFTPASGGGASLWSIGT